MSTATTVTKTLRFGLPSKDGGDPLRVVVFGKRPTVADAIKIGSNDESSLETQRTLMYAAAAITEFGGKQKTPYLSELLSLKKVDRDILFTGYLEFLALSIGERASEKLDEDTVKLGFGVKLDDGEVYDVAGLCDKSSELTGFEEIEIESTARRPVERSYVLLGYDIARLSQSEGEKVLEGPIKLDVLKRMDMVDCNALIEEVDERRLLFRRQGEAVQTDSSAGSGDSGA